MSCPVVIPYQLPNNLSSLHFLSKLTIILENEAETGIASRVGQSGYREYPPRKGCPQSSKFT
jgi:hypothetical protein